MPAAHEAEREHPPRGVVAVDRRRRQRREVGDLPADQPGVVPLLAEVELLAEAVLQLAHHLQEAVAPAERGVLRGEARQLAQHLDVDLDPPAHLRPLDLHRHLAAVGQGRAVDLGHRRGRQRRAVERGEQLAERRAQLALDYLDDLLARHRSDRVLQAGERLDVGGGQEVGAGAEELAELDEDRPQLLQRAGQLLGPGVVLLMAVERQVLVVALVPVAPQLADDLLQLILPQDAEDLRVALGVVGEAVGHRPPRRRADAGDLPAFGHGCAPSRADRARGVLSTRCA